MRETALRRRHRLASSLRKLPGYAGPGRKTIIERAPRTPAHKMPDWRLWFMLPDGMSLPSGPVDGLLCTTICPMRTVEIIAKHRNFLIGQANKLFALKAPRWRGTVLAHLSRGDEPGPTLSGPLRRGDAKVIELKITGRNPVVTDDRSMRQLELSIG